MSLNEWVRQSVVHLFREKLLCSPGLQDQHADLVLPANKNMPTYKKLLTSAGLPAQHKNCCSPNVC